MDSVGSHGGKRHRCGKNLLAEAVLMRAVSLYAIPVTLFVIVGFGFFRGTDVFSSFVTGAKDGLKTVVSVLPPLIGLFAAISVFRALCRS